MSAALTSEESGAEAARARRGVLETLETRQRLTTAQAAARSLMVRRLRIALPLVAVALVAVFLLNTRSKGVDDAFLKDFANLEATPEELHMANPRVVGIDDKGKPYEIIAESALQTPGAEDVVELVRPRAASRNAKETTVAYADRGVFQNSSKILELTDSVTVEHAVGGETYVLTTPAATVSINDETVETDAGVSGQSETGTLRADRMRAYNGEGRVVFEGNVSMRIYPKKTKGVGAEATTEPAKGAEPQ